MNPLEQYQQVKKIADERRRETDKAVGALENLLQRLKEEYGANAVEGEALLERLESKEKLRTKELEEEIKLVEQMFNERKV